MRGRRNYWIELGVYLALFVAAGAALVTIQKIYRAKDWPVYVPFHTTQPAR